MNASRAEQGEGSQATGQRTTVILIATAWKCLVHLNERTGLSNTDLTNRALILYEFFDHQLRTGHDFLTRDHATGTMELVQLLDAPAEQEARSTGAADSRRSRARRPARKWRPGRHRRPHRAPGRPRVLALAGLLTYLVFLAGREDSI